MYFIVIKFNIIIIKGKRDKKVNVLSNKNEIYESERLYIYVILCIYIVV